MNTTACNFEKSAQNALSYLTVYTMYIHQNIIYSYFWLLQQTFPICLLQLTFSCKPSNRLKRYVKNNVNLMEINLSRSTLSNAHAIRRFIQSITSSRDFGSWRDN